MPELPEVETIRRQLEKEVVGKKVEAVDVSFSGRLNVPARSLASALVGATVVAAGRRAKLLLLGFSSGWTVAIHLKMTGRLLLSPRGAKPGKHVHVVLRLSGGVDLFFEDVRKFGYWKLVPTGRLGKDIFEKEGYGPEPLDPSFTYPVFSSCVRERGRKKIKPLLMDQTCIAGVGNIYADESLWRAGVRPDRGADSLSARELRRLYEGVTASLKESLERRGSSADTYVDLYGKEGENVPALKAYGREGLPCRRCGTALKKVRFAGRGTHYCPKCQK